MYISEILKDSNFDVSQFTPSIIEKVEKDIIYEEQGKNKFFIICKKRNKKIKLAPEEVIRQMYLHTLLEKYNYPIDRIDVEYPVNFGREIKRADIIVFEKDNPTIPYIIIEVKKPKLKDGKEQLKSYCNATGAPIGVWTNGKQISYYNRKDPNYFEDISDIPTVNESLSDIVNERITFEDLKRIDKLQTEKKSLKDLILEIEDEVLANAGVDVFEEVFKLIFTKLYDELSCARHLGSYLKFRNTGVTDSELKSKIQELFNKAKDKWQGVFETGAMIELAPSHLSVCVSSLQNVKLFNSNLEVIDDAFEYLMSKVQKGEKGQFFTPRYVIDMCVRMMNPKSKEKVIDTACGSAGFTVHSIFHVWREIRKKNNLPISDLFTTDIRTSEEEEYVRNNVFAIDFDMNTVRVAKTLNLIAGDGKTNVLYLNTLDYERWNEVVSQENWNDAFNEGFRKLKQLRPNNSSAYSHFEFDVLMANPPFAGEIKESRVISKFELGKNKSGKWKNKVDRDILFIERNLNFLKPGGRMAIVLPQGRFNNSTDKYIREFISERCRILAIVGLHKNTFKPHTGTKTSVLFLQKWDDVLCPKTDNYNIFFATMSEKGKDNSGQKIYVKNEDGTNKLDSHGHLIVKHDLFNHDGLTSDGIAEAFIEFAKKEKLSFF